MGNRRFRKGSRGKNWYGITLYEEELYRCNHREKFQCSDAACFLDGSRSADRVFLFLGLAHASMRYCTGSSFGPSFTGCFPRLSTYGLALTKSTPFLMFLAKSVIHYVHNQSAGSSVIHRTVDSPHPIISPRTS